MLDVGVRVGDTKIINQLAVDDMATIYRCERRRPGRFTRTVAAKLVHRHHTESADQLQALIQEATRSAGLAHPNIVQVLDVREIEGQAFVVMEYVDGPPLVNVVVQAERRGAQHIGNVCWLLAGIARALHHAHTGGRGRMSGDPAWIHGDVVLDNILVSSDGVAKLLDFDVAGAKTRDLGAAQDFRQGRVEYTPPELLIRGAIVDHRIDIYGLGVCLYRATTGVFPFTGDAPDEVLASRRHHLPRSPSSILTDYPPQLEQIVLWCLQRDPEARPATALELAEALEGFCRTARGFASQDSVAVWLSELYPQGADAWTGFDPNVTTRTPLPYRAWAAPPPSEGVMLTPLLTAAGLGLLALLVVLFMLVSSLQEQEAAEIQEHSVTRLLDKAEASQLQNDDAGLQRNVEKARAIGPANAAQEERLRRLEKALEEALEEALEDAQEDAQEDAPGR